MLGERVRFVRNGHAWDVHHYVDAWRDAPRIKVNDSPGSVRIFIHAANGACVLCSGYTFGCWGRRAVARGLTVRHFGYCFVTSQSRVVECIGETLHYHEFSFHGLFLLGMATQVHAATGFLRHA